MAFDSIKDVIPFLGAYFATAVIICALLVTADIVKGCQKRKLWIAGRYFNGNSISVSLMSSGLTILLDLSSDVENQSINISTSTGLLFMGVMVSYLHLSLATKSPKELWSRTSSLLVPSIVLIFNKSVILFVLGYAPFSPSFALLVMVFVSPVTVSFIIPGLIRRANFRFNQLAMIPNPYSQPQTRNFSPRIQELTFETKKYWVMAQTADPEFLLACCPISYIVSLSSILFCFLQRHVFIDPFVKGHMYLHDGSDYKWGIKLLLLALAIGSLVGSIALFLRSLVLTYHSIPSKRPIIPFRVDKHWVKQLEDWREDYSLVAYLPGQNTKRAFHFLQKFVLYVVEAFQRLFMYFFEIMFFIQAFLSGPLLRICYKTLLTILRIQDTDRNNTDSDDEVYFRFAIHIDETTRPSKTYIKRCINQIDQVIRGSQNPSQAEFLSFLRHSSPDFIGVFEYDSHTDSGTHQTCWSLVVATLTGVAIANPAITQQDKDSLTACVREGLKLVAAIEKERCTDHVSVLAQCASARIWSQVDLFHRWCEFDLHTNEDESYTGFLQRLREECENIEGTIDSEHMGMVEDELKVSKYIGARCMHQISKTMLNRLHDPENQTILEGHFEDTRKYIADVLCACFTNIPSLIELKCHEVATDKREKSILMAARLLASSKDILPELENREVPVNLNSMAYINEWRASRSSSGAS